MQFYDINIAPSDAREIQVQGDYVYYLSGSAGGADSTITLRDVSGSDTVLLKPGQAYRLGTGGRNVRWIVGNYAGTGTIVGLLLMGEGEFSDNRISGSVEVNGTVSTQETGLEYGASWFDNAANLANVPAVIFTPAQNVSGAILHQSFIDSVNGGGTVNLVAKTSAPTSVGQGDSLHLGIGDGALRMNNQPIKIAAGKGLYYISSALETGGVRSVLYTLL